MHGTHTFNFPSFQSVTAADSLMNNPIDAAKQPGSSTSLISGLAPVPILSKFNDKSVGNEDSN